MRDRAAARAPAQHPAGRGRRTSRAARPLALGATLLAVAALAAGLRGHGAGEALGIGAARAEDVLLDEIAAVVNDGVVLASDVAAETAFVAAQARSSGQALPPEEVLSERVLERLIDQEIRRQHAARLGIAVDATEINRAIERVARGNEMDPLRFREALRSEGLDYERFRRNIEQELLLQRLVQREVAPRVRVSAREIDDYLEALASDAADRRRYRIRHILVAVPPSAAAEALAAAREKAEAIVARLQAGEDFAAVAAAESDGARALEGGDLGWRTLAELPRFLRATLRELEPGEISAPVRSSDGLHVVRVDERRSEEPGRLPETRARHVFLAGDAPETPTRLAEARARILGGERFDEVARQISEDPDSAQQGGELPWFGPGDMPPEFERVADALAVGELSEPFRTPFGWHLVEVLERRTRELDERTLRRRAESTLRERRVEQETERWVRQLRDESFVERRT